MDPNYKCPLPEDVVIVEEKNYWGYRMKAVEPDGGAGAFKKIIFRIETTDYENSIVLKRKGAYN
jgi:hypothetical protein